VDLTFARDANVRIGPLAPRFLDANSGVKASKSRHARPDQPPPEKCAAKARAKPPKPPREVSPEPDEVVEPEDDGLEDSAPKKLLRDQLALPPWPPLEEELRGPQAACGDAGAAIPGLLGSQFCPGVSA
jgi:hypothetical protein